MTVHHEQEPALRDLATRLTHDFSTLVQKEIELGKLEVKQKVKALSRQAMALGTGAVILFIGSLALVAALIALLSLQLAVWLSALLVGGALALTGLVLVMGAKKRMQEMDFVPRQSTESIKRDTMVMKEALR